MTYWLTAALLLRGGCRAIVRPLKRKRRLERQLKKGGNPPFKSDPVESRTLFFFSLLKRKHEIRARPSFSPRGTWVFTHAYTRGNKSLGDKPRESHPHLLERFYFLRGNRLFELETARLVRNRDYTGNGIGKQTERNFLFEASVDFCAIIVGGRVVQGVNLSAERKKYENNCLHRKNAAISLH